MNSLNERLSKLEAKIDTEEDLLTKLRKKQDSRKNILLDQLYSKYYEYLESLSLKEDNETKFIEILYYTIKYVRKNELNIGRTIELSLNPEMINEIIINFIRLNFDNYPEDFIVESIGFVSKVKLNEIEIKAEEPENEVPKKKGFFKKNKN
jgi:hypothetical protein